MKKDNATFTVEVLLGELYKEGLTVIELNSVRASLIVGYGLCEELLTEVLEVGCMSDEISRMMTLSLVKKYLYNFPALPSDIAVMIASELVSLSKKYDTGELNEIVRQLLFKEVDGEVYCQGIGVFMNGLKKYNAL